MGSYQKAPQKGITKLQYLLRGFFILLLFQLTILEARHFSVLCQL
ncbi:spn1, transposase Orf2 [Streptococcus pneumoniae GA07643]|nr:hypothetical protein SPP_0023 [Streptococcus pneumoniae P1031]EHD82807.1 spn1, transposase Orf2 [Streptococcus pneumoniae GA07643]EHE33843.1 spn1, transposase Orf2 [Streptococcus pneumoniae GA47360]EHZ32463.1 spn1, transposase Orf2 [Streptococcus pneumoniae GA18068]EJG72318.1 hypothetical protein AMCSP09_000053 [Streptococcus pneumoniae 2081074]EJG76323.1 hypothetical protein AMCSP18_000123 [Streptococcus pneumoniae 2082170]